MQLLHTFTNNLPVTAKPSSKYFLNIPPEIINLLWFADGPMKNYVSNQSNKACESEYFSIFISYKEEPSLIHQSDVIGKVLYPPQNLGYYPSYNQLSANARASYLNWLENIDNEIDIGYVFIFYYGLERFLYFDDTKYDQTFKMILRLRAHHTNASFQAYSYDALTSSCIIKNRPDLLKLLFEQNHSPSILSLACMAKFNLNLITDDIIMLSTKVGFKNKRYIKSHKDLFTLTLSNLIKERFGNLGYPLSEKHLSEGTKSEQLLYANYSLDFRSHSIPDITQGKTFREDLYALMSDTHDKVKHLLREERKNQH